MGQIKATVGIIGGNGALGSAIAKAMLKTDRIAPENLWISCRSGAVSGFDHWPGMHVTNSNQELVEACDIVLLAVPPQLVSTVDVRITEQLLVSVMAGVTIDRLKALTGAARVIRAMSSPAAEMSLAYSPWYAPDNITDRDKDAITAIFNACGLTDAVGSEDQIDRFTAMTGPVPGFVAQFADSMVQYATRNGIAPEIADRAIRQLFRASGEILSQAPETPAEQVQAMIDYAGTTGAGLSVMKASALAEDIGKGLDAAVEKARTIGEE